MLLEQRKLDGLPEIGKDYDWDCPDVGMLRVTVLGYAPQTSDRLYAQSLAHICRVKLERGQAWVSICDLREIDS